MNNVNEQSHGTVHIARKRRDHSKVINGIVNQQTVLNYGGSSVHGRNLSSIISNDTKSAFLPSP